jgi:uncharacterized protein (TIRG00374 family)
VRVTVLRILLVVAGVASVGYLAALTGLDGLLTAARTLSWRMAVLLVFPYTVVALLHTLAWRCLLPRHRVSVGRLFRVRLAGEALNVATWSVGGEPVKAYLLRPSVPFVDACATLVVEKTSLTIAQMLFLALALGITIPLFAVPAAFLRAMWALLGVQVVAIAGLVLLQLGGVSDRVFPRLGRLGVAPSGSYRERLVAFDRSVTASYATQRGAILLCTLIHLLGWVAGSLEVYLVLRWLDVHASFTDALAIDAFGTGVKFLAFAIPGALGVLEGGFMLVFAAFGLSSGLGLSFTLIRRLRMVAWSALGVLLLGFLRSATTAAVPATMPSRSHRAASGP